MCLSAAQYSEWLRSRSSGRCTCMHGMWHVHVHVHGVYTACAYAWYMHGVCTAYVHGVHMAFAVRMYMCMHMSCACACACACDMYMLCMRHVHMHVGAPGQRAAYSTPPRPLLPPPPPPPHPPPPPRRVQRRRPNPLWRGGPSLASPLALCMIGSSLARAVACSC